MQKGILFLIPIPLGEDALFSLPDYCIKTIHGLDYFIAERARTTRRFIKTTNPPRPISDLIVFELDKREPEKGIDSFLAPALSGNDIGLMSEAGCPGVADPGAKVVAQAHKLGIAVKPLVGPSSLLLALMASGMNGQSFSFVGYLPQKTPDLVREIKRLESRSKKYKQTQLFIETPYRNNALLKTLIDTLSANTTLGIASRLTLPDELIISKPVAQWKKMKSPDLHKKPTVFLIL